MFVMTSDIVIGKYRVKPNSVKWKTSVLSPSNTCTISLPRVSYLANTLDTTDDGTRKKKQTFVFSEGDKVSVSLGYDGNNTLRFMGFIKNINVTDKLDLECEGYSYQLPKVFSASYSSVTVKQLLTDLVKGTEIQISDKIPVVTLQNVRLKNASGWQVLDYLKKEVHLNSFFDNQILFCGTRFGYLNSLETPVKLRIGWNVAEDREFKKRRTEKNVRINLVSKNSKGEVKKTKSDEKKYSENKEVKIKSGLESAILKQIANDLQTAENYAGYEGSLTCFLLPVLQKSGVVQIIDERFPEREGLFFVETLEGSFDSSGGRQKITLNYYHGG